MKKTFCIAAAFLFSGVMKAQDIHFSQFYASPLTLNPAMTGLFNGCYRAAVNYRNQWGSFLGSSSYKTLSASGDMVFLKGRGLLGNDFLGGGAMFYTDKSGDAGFTVTKISASGAYHKALDATHNLSLGIQAGYTQERLDPSLLVFPLQWNNGSFDPNQSNGEPNPINDKTSYIDLQSGLVWYANFNDKVAPYAGVSGFHLLSPKESFLDATSKLPMRIVAHGGARIRTGQNLSILPNVIYMTQKKAQEINFGMAVEYDMPDNETPNAFGSLGAWYRMGDAFIVVAGFGYNNINLGISYDFNISELSNVSNGKGGFEFSLTYMGLCGKPVPRKMVIPCPRLF